MWGEVETCVDGTVVSSRGGILRWDLFLRPPPCRNNGEFNFLYATTPLFVSSTAEYHDEAQRLLYFKDECAGDCRGYRCWYEQIISLRTHLAAWSNSALVGPTGLSMLKTLREDGFQVTCFERRTQVGGLWAYTDDTSMTTSLRGADMLAGFMITAMIVGC